MAQSMPTVPTIQVAHRTANKNIKFFVGGVMVMLAIFYLIYAGTAGNAAYFLTVDELLAKGTAIENRTVRVAGKVDAATINFNNHDLILTFEVTGDTGRKLPVIFHGPKPDQMREGAEAILEGKYNGQIFTAGSLLLKCPSRYEEKGVEEVKVNAVK